MKLFEHGFSKIVTLIVANKNFFFDHFQVLQFAENDDNFFEDYLMRIFRKSMEKGEKHENSK